MPKMSQTKDRFNLAVEVEEFFKLRCCECEDRCRESKADSCKVRYTSELAAGMEEVGFIKGQRRCYRCERVIKGQFFIPDGDLNFCSIACHTTWLNSKQSAKDRREKRKSSNATSVCGELLASGHGSETEDRTLVRRRRKPGRSDA